MKRSTGKLLVSAALLSVLGVGGMAAGVPARAAQRDAAPAEPRIHVAPAAAMPGDKVLVKGNGWPARIKVSFSLGGANTGAGGNYGTATVDASGRIQAFVTLRALPNGQPIPTPSTVVLVAHTADYRLKATAPIVVARPGLSTNRASGRAGTTVTLNGHGWPAGTHVIVSMGGANTGAGGNYGSAVAGARGCFVVRATLARLPNGSPLPAGWVTLLAHTSDGSLKASVPFTITR